MKQKLKCRLFYLSILVVTIGLISGCDDEPEPVKVPPGSIVDIEGNLYKTVKIGTQVWMAENLRVTHYRNGDPIPELKQISWQNTDEGACCNINDHPDNTKIFGKFYNGFAVLDSRNIAPEGWHIPSDKEWLTLIENLGGKWVAGGKLKDTTISWIKPNIGATNESGFAALPGGYRSVDMSMDKKTYYNGYWWSSTEHDSNNIYFMFLSNSTAYATGMTNNIYKLAGLSVRCVKD